MSDHSTHSESTTLMQESTIRTVGIVGEGKMGSGIFHSLIGQPFRLRWIGSRNADVESLKNQVDKKIRRAVKTGTMSQQQAEIFLAQTVISSDLHDAADCDLIIEAIPEVVQMKQELFQDLDHTVQPSCILASNSSSINPSALFTGTGRDSMIIGIHYFYPVQLKESVEVTITTKTTPDVREKVMLFLESMHKQILELNESNSFILNKLFLDIQNEAYLICERGMLSEEQMDQLVRKHLFPIGIFDFMDHVGIDTMLNSVTNYIAGYPNKVYYSGLVSRLQQLAEEGKTGKKAGQGFYLYRDGQPVISDSLEAIPSETINEITEYMKYIFLNTAKRFVMQSGCTIGEMNLAIREYFGLEKGPFE